METKLDGGNNENGVEPIMHKITLCSKNLT